MRHERGNILFLILLAVILFAALSYAVTSSLRGGGNDASSETVKTQAAGVVQYVTSLSATIMRMKLVNDCTDTQISFVYDNNNDGVLNASDTYYNPNAPSDFSCNVFHPFGGGLSFKEENDKLFATCDGNSYCYTYIFNGQNALTGVGTSGGANFSSVDLVTFLSGISKPLCDELNRELGVTYKALGYYAAPFQGAYDTDYSMGAAGAQAGCFMWGGQFYVFYHTLIAR